mgnify:CR=1 FL=1
MSKQLNELTGKGYLVAKGQVWVENYLETHTQAELAELCQFRKNGGPNAGAVSVALKSLGWASFSGQQPVKLTATAKPATVKAKPATADEFVGPPVEKLLPGRIEVLLEMLGHDVHITGVIAAIEENTVAWCTQVRKMGVDEKALMRAYTGLTAWTLADQAHEKREEKRLRPFIISDETVAKFAGIDTGLVQRENRFESSRYDADLVTFYLAD